MADLSDIITPGMPRVGPPTFTAHIRCGETLHVLVAGSEGELARLVEATAKRLLRANGDTVRFPGGESAWIVDEEIHPAQWHSDGNRVRAWRVRYDKGRDGTVTQTVLRTVWVNP